MGLVLAAQAAQGSVERISDVQGAYTPIVLEHSRYDVPGEGGSLSQAWLNTRAAIKDTGQAADLNCYGNYCLNLVDGQWWVNDPLGVPYKVDHAPNGY